MTARETGIGGRDGSPVRLTNPTKVLYPEYGTTKAEVAEYYRAIASHLLPHTRSRPATLKRWVDGVGTRDHPRSGFFQKDVAQPPEWLHTIPVQHRDHMTHQVDVRDEVTIMWAAQLAALEIHVPQWRVDHERLQQPSDRIVFDLDPGPGVGLPECAEVARRLRLRLSELGLASAPVTSGSKGIHLYAPLGPLPVDVTPGSFARGLASVIERDLPDLVVTQMAKAKRSQRVLIDWSQNNPAKTTVAPYSLRGRPTPTVAAPRTWEELDDPALRHLRLDEVLVRVAAGTSTPLDTEITSAPTADRPLRLPPANESPRSGR